MVKRPTTTSPTPAPATATPRRPAVTPGRPAVTTGDLYTITEAKRRLNWGHKTLIKAQHDGLRTVQYGRTKYVTGADILEFFRKLADN